MRQHTARHTRSAHSIPVAHGMPLTLPSRSPAGRVLLMPLLLLLGGSFLALHWRAAHQLNDSILAPGTTMPSAITSPDAATATQAGVTTIKIIRQTSSQTQQQAAPAIHTGSASQACSCGPILSQAPWPAFLAHSGRSDDFNTSPGSRYFSIGSWRHTKPPETQRMVYQQAGGVEGDLRFFVGASDIGLSLGMDRWMLAGARLPDNATDMAASGDVGKLQVLAMLQQVKQLGLNTIRVVAYKDGHTLLQPVSVRASTGPAVPPPSGVTVPTATPQVPPPSFGFVNWAEKINGRAAMIGFFALLLVEGIAGKGILELVGFTTGNGLGFEL